MNFSDFVKEFFIETIDKYPNLIRCYDADDGAPVVVVSDRFDYFTFLDDLRETWLNEHNNIWIYDINVLKFNDDYYSFALGAGFRYDDGKPCFSIFNYLVKEIKL